MIAIIAAGIGFGAVSLVLYLMAKGLPEVQKTTDGMATLNAVLAHTAVRIRMVLELATALLGALLGVMLVLAIF